MAEYAGYVATPPVNYGEITDGLVSNIISIEQAKREEQKEKLKRSLISILIAIQKN